MIKRLLIVAVVAVVTTVATAASDPALVAADSGGEPMRVVSSVGVHGAAGAGAIQTSGQVNPWGCYFHRDNPHESLDDPGPGHAQAKAWIKCRVAPPAHVATIWQELQKWGLTVTIEAVKTSICPSGVGEPDCYPTLNHRVLMRAYVNAPCEIGTTAWYVQLAYATMTVGGTTYASGLGSRGADVYCGG